MWTAVSSLVQVVKFLVVGQLALMKILILKVLQQSKNAANIQFTELPDFSSTFTDENHESAAGSTPSSSSYRFASQNRNELP